MFAEHDPGFDPCTSAGPKRREGQGPHRYLQGIGPLPLQIVAQWTSDVANSPRLEIDDAYLRGHRITLVSFEKAGRSNEERGAVRTACAAAGIDWRPLRYHKRPPVLSTVYDLQTMRLLVVRVQREQRFDVVHCRSYLPALVG